MFVRKNYDKFPTISTIHHYETRYNHEILIPNYRLATCRKSPHCICSYIYNKIPKHMKQLNSNKKIKITLQIYLDEKMYYSMKEFFDDWAVGGCTLSCRPALLVTWVYVCIYGFFIYLFMYFLSLKYH